MGVTERVDDGAGEIAGGGGGGVAAEVEAPS